MLLIRRLSATSSETVGSMAWHRMTIFIRFKHKTMWQIMKKVLMSTERSTNLAATRNVPTLFYLKQISWSPLQYKSMCTGSSIFYAMTKVVNICAWMRCFLCKWLCIVYQKIMPTCTSMSSSQVILDINTAHISYVKGVEE